PPVVWKPYWRFAQSLKSARLASSTLPTVRSCASSPDAVVLHVRSGPSLIWPFTTTSSPLGVVSSVPLVPAPTQPRSPLTSFTTPVSAFVPLQFQSTGPVIASVATVPLGQK